MFDFQIQLDSSFFRFYLCLHNLEFCLDNKGCFLCLHRADFGNELDLFSLTWGWFPDPSLPWRWEKEKQQTERDSFASGKFPF